MPSPDLRSPHQAARILLLEDSTLDAELICQNLEKLRPSPIVHRAVNRAQYEAALEQREFDVILSDFSLPDFDGMAAFEMASVRMPETPFIFVSGVLGEEAAIECFRRGATDYVLKQRLIRLSAAVERALSEASKRAELRRVEHHREILVRELSHRVKNTMAMVMSIVRRTAKNCGNVNEYVENLIGRLRAMADAHALLFETNWNEARIEDVVQRTLSAYVRDAERIVLDAGPSTSLGSKAALSFSLVLNELVTNAIKYGALSYDSGRIHLKWTVEPASQGNKIVVFRWQELGGPRVTTPAGGGFGTTLIQGMIEYELLGRVQLDFAASGLVCELSFQLDNSDGELSSLSPLARHMRDENVSH
ncbi:HWE histidine kinase domain-containing protein [Rhizobium sp. FY34]|uniref:sensor histidine kinase n=1 Tax=Rhizobium sp. FY34 TaxID=2562309 RepID=UPI0010BFDB42|nr:HWE histidine kinase domain-containing protein [Rhizobium sp. FY34]